MGALLRDPGAACVLLGAAARGALHRRDPGCPGRPGRRGHPRERADRQPGDRRRPGERRRSPRSGKPSGTGPSLSAGVEREPRGWRRCGGWVAGAMRTAPRPDRHRRRHFQCSTSPAAGRAGAEGQCRSSTTSPLLDRPPPLLRRQGRSRQDHLRRGGRPCLAEKPGGAPCSSRPTPPIPWPTSSKLPWETTSVRSPTASGLKARELDAGAAFAAWRAVMPTSRRRPGGFAGDSGGRRAAPGPDPARARRAGGRCPRSWTRCWKRRADLVVVDTAPTGPRPPPPGNTGAAPWPGTGTCSRSSSSTARRWPWGGWPRSWWSCREPEAAARAAPGPCPHPLHCRHPDRPSCPAGRRSASWTSSDRLSISVPVVIVNASIGDAARL